MMIMHLLTSASLRRCISRTGTLKLCLTLPTPLTLSLVTFSCSHTPRNVLLGEEATQDHPLDQSFSSVFHIFILKIKINMESLDWLWINITSDNWTHLVTQNSSGPEWRRGILAKVEAVFLECDKAQHMHQLIWRLTNPDWWTPPEILFASGTELQCDPSQRTGTALTVGLICSGQN